MENTAKEMMRNYVKSQKFSSTGEIMEAARNEFLKQEQRLANLLTMEQLYNIEIEWESIQPALMMDLECVLLDLYQKYAKIEIEDLVGAVS